jgi:RecJ-like exonuclease
MKEFKHVATAPNGEAIVSLLSYEGVVYVATDTRVYTLEERELKPIELNWVVCSKCKGSGIIDELYKDIRTCERCKGKGSFNATISK